jgi:hypothetical protein
MEVFVPWQLEQSKSGAVAWVLSFKWVSGTRQCHGWRRQARSLSCLERITCLRWVFLLLRRRWRLADTFKVWWSDARFDFETKTNVARCMGCLCQRSSQWIAGVWMARLQTSWWVTSDELDRLDGSNGNRQYPDQPGTEQQRGPGIYVA